MSLLALGRNGRSQAGAEASGLDSLMGWAYTTIEFTLFLWSIAVGLAYDGLAALLTSRVYRAGAGAVLLYLLGTTLIELVASGDGGPELLFFLRMAVFVYCVGYQVRALCDYTPVRVLLLLRVAPYVQGTVQLWGSRNGLECACRGSSLTQSARGWCHRPSGGSRGEPEQTTQQESE